MSPMELSALLLFACPLLAAAALPAPGIAALVAPAAACWRAQR
jgi:hypothetical protein